MAARGGSIVKRRAARPDWPAVAQALAAAVPRARLHPAVLAWAATPAARRAAWAVGFSGGADSLALLLLLWAHWPERRGRLSALHFDHRMRGAASRADAAFCRAVCRALRVDCVTGVWAGEHADASEAEARAARLEFFAAQGRTLWLGHQQDDVAESLLMRLARGSGAGGLAAPRPLQRFTDGRLHVRPLLALKKAELVSALRAAGAVWREDASNARPKFLRNRIRADVLPAWAAAAGRDAVAGAARSRTLLEEDDAALEAWADRVAVRDRRRRLPLAGLAGVPRAVVRRALHRWLGAQRRRIDLSSQAFELLLAAVEEGRPTRQSLGVGLFATIRAGWLEAVAERKSRRNFRRRIN